MKKITSVVLAAILILTMVAACGANDSAPAPAPAPDPAPAPAPDPAPAPAPESGLSLGVSLGTTGNLFFATMAEILSDYGAQNGIEVFISDENWDLNNQITSIENFISMGVTAIIMVVFDNVGVVDVVRRAVDAGIIVMAYDGIIDGAQGSLNLDNYVYGYQTGTMAAEWINSNPELAAQERIEVGIMDYPDIPIIIDRANGIIDALAELAPNTVVVAQQLAGVGDEGVVVGEIFLAAHPNMQVVAGINDTGVLGAYQVFTAAGHVGDHIGLFGADGDPMALELIAEGSIYRGTVMTGAYDALPIAVDLLMRASRGENVNLHIVYDTIPITPVNVHEFLD
jgi:ribose transport system substrate-binding protein